MTSNSLSESNKVRVITTMIGDESDSWVSYADFKALEQTVEKLRQENATLSAYIDNVNSAVADLMKELAGTTK